MHLRQPDLLQKVTHAQTANAPVVQVHPLRDADLQSLRERGLKVQAACDIVIVLLGCPGSGGLALFQDNLRRPSLGIRRRRPILL